MLNKRIKIVFLDKVHENLFLYVALYDVQITIMEEIIFDDLDIYDIDNKDREQ